MDNKILYRTAITGYRLSARNGGAAESYAKSATVQKQGATPHKILTKMDLSGLFATYPVTPN